MRHVLFLDEPTLGLDVSASRDVRAFVRRWVNEEAHMIGDRQYVVMPSGTTLTAVALPASR